MNNLPYTSASAGGSCQITPTNPSCSSCIAGAVGSLPSADQQTDQCPGSASGSFAPCLQYPIDQDWPGSVPVDQM